MIRHRLNKRLTGNTPERKRTMSALILVTCALIAWPASRPVLALVRYFAPSLV